MCGYGDVTAVGHGDGSAHRHSGHKDLQASTQTCTPSRSHGEGQGMTSSILEQGGKVLVPARPAATPSRLSSKYGASRMQESSNSSRCSPSSRSHTLSQVQANWLSHGLTVQLDMVHESFHECNDLKGDPPVVLGVCNGVQVLSSKLYTVAETHTHRRSQAIRHKVLTIACR